MSHGPALLVAPGGSVTAWSNRAGRAGSALSVVAVDPEGCPRGYGESALRMAGPDRSVVRPFTAMSVRDARLTRAYVEWLAGSRSRSGLAILIPYHARAREVWESLAAEFRCSTAVLYRPLAMVAGLGLETISHAEMVLAVDDEGVEIALVVDGEVVLSRHALGSSPVRVASEVRSALLQVDPDLEWDVSEAGIHAVGSMVGEDWAGSLSERLEIEVMVSDLSVMFDGARTSLEIVEEASRRPVWSALRHRLASLTR